MTTPRFLKTVWASFQPSEYGHLRSRSLGQACWYLSRVLFCASIIFAVWVGVGAYVLFPSVKAGVMSVLQELPDMYPEGLVVNVENGVLKTNRSAPVRIEIPAKWKTLLGADKGPDGKELPIPSLLVIDTMKQAEDFSSLNTFALLTRSSFVIKDKNNGLRMIPFGKEQKFEVTKAKYLDGVEQAKAFLPTIARIARVALIAIVVLIPFVAGSFGLLWWMAASLVIALVMLLWSAILKRTWTYGELYRASLFGATPLVVSQAILGIIPGLNFLLPTWLIFVWMAVVVAVAGAPLKKSATKKGAKSKA